MPDCAAHYQFGQDVLGRLDTDLRARALACKREYDIGLQGPDPFFFYRPWRKTKVAGYGTARHEQPAVRMFAPILAQVHEKAAFSYLMGLVCHYTLDAFCHPYVNGHSRDPLDHFLMEAAYDRHILSRCGSSQPRYRLIPASGLNFAAISSLWPGMKPDIVRKCVKSMRFYTRLADRKGIVLFLETAAGKRGAFSPMSLSKGVPQEQREYVRRLNELYAEALEECPKKIRSACAAMGTVPLRLAGFDLNYEGEAEHDQAGETLDPL